ncbi:MAG: AIR synthase related protein [Candidatus Nanopelagicales bacterium]
MHLRQFGEQGAGDPTRCWSGIGENAGVVDIGDGWAVTFKVESAQPPVATSSRTRARPPAWAASCATSSAMGARPLAVMDQLRFGAADDPDTAPGRARGRAPASGGYGNCLGLPNIGGEAVFDPLLPGQPAGQRAVRRARMRHRGHPPGQRSRCRQPGRPLRRPHRRRRHRRGVGAGQSRPSTTDGPEPSGPAVQVGDPFTEKLLIECTLELLARRAGRGHPGPRRRGAVVRHLRAGQQRRRRHARLAGPGAAARPER